MHSKDSSSPKSENTSANEDSSSFMTAPNSAGSGLDVPLPPSPVQEARPPLVVPVHEANPWSTDNVLEQPPGNGGRNNERDGSTRVVAGKGQEGETPLLQSSTADEEDVPIATLQRAKQQQGDGTTVPTASAGPAGSNDITTGQPPPPLASLPLPAAGTAASTATAGPSAAAAAAAPRLPSLDSADVYQVKEIVFLDSPARDKRVRIVCQNVNGPCPLLAICNVLCLRGDLRLPVCETVTFEQLAHELGEYLVTRQGTQSPTATAAPATATATSSADAAAPAGSKEMDLETSLRLVPRLTRGLDVNVCFDDIGAFDAGSTPELALFRACGVQLLHGWVVDPQDAQAAAVLGHAGARARTFNDAVVLAVSHPDTPEGAVARDFLDATATQLTAHGLVELATTAALPDRALCALFRNNHFHVLYRRARGELYTLVSDVGYAAHAHIVWESLASIDGDSVFVDAQFSPATMMSTPTRDRFADGAPSGQASRAPALPQRPISTTTASAAGPSATDDPDHALALRLQREEEEAYMRHQQQVQMQQQRQGPPALPSREGAPALPSRHPAAQQATSSSNPPRGSQSKPEETKDKCLLM